MLYGDVHSNTGIASYRTLALKKSFNSCLLYYRIYAVQEFMHFVSNITESIAIPRTVIELDISNGVQRRSHLLDRIRAT